jgi:hypothetical protein
MKTLQEQETQAILKLGELHNHQREVIFTMSKKIEELESAVSMANGRIAYLEAQVYGGSTK